MSAFKDSIDGSEYLAVVFVWVNVEIGVSCQHGRQMSLVSVVEDITYKEGIEEENKEIGEFM